MHLASLVMSLAFSAVSYEDVPLQAKLTLHHDDRTEVFTECLFSRESRMGMHGDIYLYCQHAPAIQPYSVPRFQGVGDWSYYVTTSVLVWDDSRCKFVEAFRSWGNTDTMVLDCRRFVFKDGFEHAGSKEES